MIVWRKRGRFFFLNRVSLYSPGYHSPSDGHLGCVQLSAVVTTLNVGIELPSHVLDFNYFGCASRSVIFGSYSHSVFNFFKLKFIIKDL